jgi:hypothetical protein
MQVADRSLAFFPLLYEPPRGKPRGGSLLVFFAGTNRFCNENSAQSKPHYGQSEIPKEIKIPNESANCRNSGRQ